MRNLIVIAKVCVGVDPTVDTLIKRLSSIRDLFDLVASTQSGRGLLYWASYYDPWLMGDDLDLTALQLRTEPVAGTIVEVGLAEDTWARVNVTLLEKHQWPEQDWLVWQFWQAFDMYREFNSAARMFFGRDVLGASLSDSEVLGERR